MNSDEVPRDELLEHSGITRCVAWSSNESHLASGHVGGGVWIWDSESGAPIDRVLKTQSKSVEYLAWSPDDSRLAYVNLNDRVSAWEVATGKQIMEEIQNGERVVSTAWSPDGSLLAWGLEDSTVLVWYVHKNVLRTFRRMVRNDENYRSIRGVLRWSADGKQLTSCDLYDMSRMCTWDVTTGATITTAEENFFEKQKRITAEDASIFCHVEGHETRLATFEASNFAYSPSGQYIAVAHHSGLGLCKLVE